MFLIMNTPSHLKVNPLTSLYRSIHKKSDLAEPCWWLRWQCSISFPTVSCPPTKPMRSHFHTFSWRKLEQLARFGGSADEPGLCYDDMSSYFLERDFMNTDFSCKSLSRCRVFLAKEEAVLPAPADLHSNAFGRCSW